MLDYMRGSVVVLDACVLFPASLRDCLLYAAQADLYQVRWSELILAEVSKNLVARAQTTREKADKLLTTMQAAFPEAMVNQRTIIPLIETLTNDPKDRHVLAAAIVTQAQHIVTVNLTDFPPASLGPYNITALSPDEFVSALYADAPDMMMEVIRTQSAALKHPPKSVDEVLATLSQHVPTMVQRLRTMLP